MTLNYPLRFEPIYRRYLWGGRRLATVLGRELPPGDDYAESWEVVDHGADQSVVENGPLRGRTLGELVRAEGPALFGRHHPQTQFPLLFKLLDAHRDLSVQVHPNDDQAAKQTPPDRGKTEAWVVVHAAPHSCIYAGLQPGVDAATLRAHLAAGTLEQVLHRVQPSVGDALLIPAGTVHAIGAGLIIAEIQQASDTTFRLYDWNRVGADGRPRPLHIDAALAVIDFQRGPIQPAVPVPIGEQGVARLIECDKFVIHRRSVTATQTVGGDDRFHLLSTTSGGIGLVHDRGRMTLRRGQTVLLPAAAGTVHVDLASRPDRGELLDMFLP